jgi:hypothetical protein
MVEISRRSSLLFLISAFIVIIANIIGIYSYFKRPTIEDDEKIFIHATIELLKDKLEDNNQRIFPLLSFINPYQTTEYKQNYETLLKQSSNPCASNLKKCGILDSLGHLMCIPLNEECPINEAIIDLKSKQSDYESQGYEFSEYYDLSSNYYIYYSNTKTDNRIVVKVERHYLTPTYLTHEDYNPTGGVGNDDDDYYSRRRNSLAPSNDFRSLRLSKDTFYGQHDIFTPGDNIDKTLTHISEHIYVGNYIGFENSWSMETFMESDLEYLYNNQFPDSIGVGFLFAGILLFGLLIIFTSCKLCCIKFFSECFRDISPVCAKLEFIIPYLLFTLGYFIYSINCYYQLYTKQHLGDLLDIEADDLIEGLSTKVRNRHLSAGYHIINIILMVVSLIIFITSEVVDCIFNKGCPKSNQNGSSYYVYQYSSN